MRCSNTLSRVIISWILIMNNSVDFLFHSIFIIPSLERHVWTEFIGYIIEILVNFYHWREWSAYVHTVSENWECEFFAPVIFHTFNENDKPTLDRFEPYYSISHIHHIWIWRFSSWIGTQSWILINQNEIHKSDALQLVKLLIEIEIQKQVIHWIE